MTRQPTPTDLPVTAAFYRAARTAAELQLRGEYDETAEDAYETTRDAMLRLHAIERVDEVDDLAFRAAMRDAGR